MSHTIDISQAPYNVIDDPSIDQTDAIQQAIWDSSGKELIFPGGTYLITRCLDVTERSMALFLYLALAWFGVR